MGLSRYEQETIINFNEAEAKVEIYTASQKVMRRLTKKGFHQNKKPIRNETLGIGNNHEIA